MIAAATTSPAGAPAPVVRLVDVHKRFGRHVVLDGVSLEDLVRRVQEASGVPDFSI